MIIAFEDGETVIGRGVPDGLSQFTQWCVCLGVGVLMLLG
jgi:hypothetical protein